MTVEEMEKALQYGADIVTDCYNEGCNVISFGEMGIGNTAASSMWMTCLTQIPLIDCVGAGSGLDSEGVRHKYNVLKRSLENYKGDGSALDVMRYFGGYEMVMAVGGMLRAAELKMIILVDGFIMTNCVLVASAYIRRCNRIAYSGIAATRPGINGYWISWGRKHCSI